jgi:anaerobic magnesium-protoporphyrin IX monomethyl ester cyclase
VNADYRFLDPRLDVLYDWLLRTFARRNSSTAGTVNLLRLLLFESNLRLPGRAHDPALRHRSRQLTSVANRVALDTIEAALEYIYSEPDVSTDAPFLATLSALLTAEDQRLQRDVTVLVDRLPDLQERLHLTR